MFRWRTSNLNWQLPHHLALVGRVRVISSIVGWIVIWRLGLDLLRSSIGVSAAMIARVDGFEPQFDRRSVRLLHVPGNRSTWMGLLFCIRVHKLGSVFVGVIGLHVLMIIRVVTYVR